MKGNRSKTCKGIGDLDSDQFPAEEISKADMIYLQLALCKCQAKGSSV